MKETEPKNSYTPRYKRPSIAKAMRPYADVIKGIHPDCNSVPDIGRRDFDSLVDSIEIHGLTTPIQIDEQGLLVDGRCRLRACHVLGVSLTDDQIQVSEVDSAAIADANFARRHLTRGQKAMRACRLLDEERAKAKERKKAGAAKGRANRGKQLGTDTVPSKKKRVRQPRAIDIVAKSTGLSRDAITEADLLRQTDPELAKRVEMGMITIEDAFESLDLPKNKKKKKRKKRKAKQRRPVPTQESTSPSDSILFDGLAETRKLESGIWQIRSPSLSVFLNDGIRFFGIAYRGPSRKWHIRIAGSSRCQYASNQMEAEQTAVNWLLED